MIKSRGASMPEAHSHLHRGVSLQGAVFALVGYIVGGSIFILPGALAATTGPGVFISYLMACLPALFLCFVGAQIGNALPVSGANCIAVSAVLGPMWGFLLVWILLAAMLFAIAPLAFGFADYLAVYLPALGEHRTLIALGCVVVFWIINLAGVGTAIGVQTAMVVVFMTALFGFGVGGLFAGDLGNLRPIFPNGLDPVVAAAVPAYYSYSGFMMIVSLGGEVRNPRRNLPLTLLVGFVVIMITYTLVSMAVPALIHWSELGEVDAPVSRAAAIFMPPILAQAMTAAALLAIASSINGLLLAKSRDIYALAAAQVFPSVFGRVGRNRVPGVAVGVIASLAVLGMLARGSFAQYASLSVLCIMAIQIMAGLVLIRLPTRLPEHFAAATLQLGPGSRWFWGLGTVALAIFFILRAVSDNPTSLGLLAGLVATGMLAYRIRKQLLERRGLAIGQLLEGDLESALKTD
ncbi:MAG: APC family permease [Acidobacteriota bacterium]|nr:APC family permease [Acidobacteriota bacterium]